MTVEMMGANYLDLAREVLVSAETNPVWNGIYHPTEPKLLVYLQRSEGVFQHKIEAKKEELHSETRRPVAKVTAEKPYLLVLAFPCSIWSSSVWRNFGSETAFLWS